MMMVALFSGPFFLAPVCVGAGVRVFLCETIAATRRVRVGGGCVTEHRRAAHNHHNT